MKREILQGVTLAIVLCSSSSAASALYFNSKDAPLTVSRLGDHAYTYGSWSISTKTDGTRSRGAVWLQTNSPNNNYPAFVEMETWVNSGHCIEPQYTSCSKQYFKHAETWTGEQRAASYKRFNLSTNLTPSADYARGVFRVKMAIRWAPDPTSGDSYTKGMKY